VIDIFQHDDGTRLIHDVRGAVHERWLGREDTD
jgi:hypothetical protein